MISIRIWNVETDSSTKAVEFLKDEFLRSQKLGYLAIRSAGRSALRKCHRKGVPVNESLREAIQHYLKQDDFIVFVTNDANPKLNNQRLVDALKHVVKDNNFADKIYFAQDIQDSQSSVNAEWQVSFRIFAQKLKVIRNNFEKTGIK